MGKRKYNTEEERKAARNESSRLWKQRNKEKRAEYMAEYMTEYRKTKYGRAQCILGAYQRDDKKYNRGECTLTEDWIVDNIFSGQVCHYCGESDWAKLGCDRKDSRLPHTPENCVPCCHACNIKKKNTPYDLYMKMIGKIA